MKSLRLLLLSFIFLKQAWSTATNGQTNPLAKVLEMLDNMQKEVIKGGEEQAHAYSEFSEMCEDRSRELQHEIKSGQATAQDLAATIDKATDDEAEADSQIGELTGVISSAQSDVKAATMIRTKEAKEFIVVQKDLIDTISKIERSISILEKMLRKVGGASFVQEKESLEQQRAEALSQAFAAIVDASVISSADADGLSSLIQTSEDEADGDSQLDNAADSYADNQKGDDEKGSSSLVETFENLLEKAQASLQSARVKETNEAHNYALFKQSLDYKVETQSKALAEAKKEKAEAGQTKAEAEGDVEIAKKELEEDKKALSQLHHECMARAADFEDETKSRNEEMKALAVAKKVLKEMTGDAEKATYSDLAQVSFLQTKSQHKSTNTLPGMDVVRAVRHLGQEFKVRSFMQLAKKIESVVRTSTVSGADPFAKVKGLLTDMLEALKTQMENEASHKAYCDKEMADTQKHKAEKESSVERLSTKIDTQTSKSMNLRRQVADLQKELLSIIATQKDMDVMRQDEHAAFLKMKPEMEEGVEGVKKALSVLRDYYAKGEEEENTENSQRGGGSGVISMLEVIESDFTKGLAALEEGESAAQSEYENQTHENQLAKATKEKDVTYKTKQAKALDKSTAESSTDRDGVQSQLDAVNEYYAKIQEECVAKPDTYEERRKRHEEMLKGLKDAQDILEARAAFVQGPRRMRGTRAHRSKDVDNE
jgi:hypothetical protein